MATSTFKIDSFFPQGEFNTNFNIIDNSEIEPNPMWVWFDADKLFFRKRDGIKTDENWNWDVDADIANMRELSWELVIYSKFPSIYTFDWTNLTKENISDITLETNKKYDDILNISYLWWWRFPDDTKEYTVQKVTESDYLIIDENWFIINDTDWNTKLNHTFSWNPTFNKGNAQISPYDNFNTMFYVDDTNEDIYKLKLDKLINWQTWGETSHNFSQKITDEFWSIIVSEISLLTVDQWNELRVFFSDSNANLYVLKYDSGFNFIASKQVQQKDNGNSTISELDLPDDNMSVPFWKSWNSSIVFLNWKQELLEIEADWDLETLDTLWNPRYIFYEKDFGNYYVQDDGNNNVIQYSWTGFTKNGSVWINTWFWDRAIDKLDSWNMVIIWGDWKIRKVAIDGFTIQKEVLLPNSINLNSYDNVTVSEDWKIYVSEWGWWEVAILNKDFEILDTINSHNIWGSIDNFNFQALRKEFSELDVEDIKFKEDLVDINLNVDPTAYIDKIAYVKKKVNNWERETEFQWRRVSNVKDQDFNDFNKTLVLTRSFITELNDWDKVIFYNNMQEQQWFPQIRDINNLDRLLARDSSGNTMFWNFPKAKKIVQFDWRIFILTEDGQWLIPSFADNYEVFDTNRAIEFFEQEVINIQSFSWMLVVFFKDTIWVVSRTTINSDTWQFIYTYQDIINIWPFTKEAFSLSEKWFYFFWTDNVLYSVAIEVDDTGSINVNTQTLSTIIETYLDDIKWGEVFITYEFWRLWLIHKENGITQIFKYIAKYESWIRDEYNLTDNFGIKVVKFQWERYAFNDNQLVYWSEKQLTDLWNNFTQKLKVYWPVQWIMNVFTLLRLKIRFWFDGVNKIWWKVKVVVWANKTSIDESNVENTEIINTINNEVDNNTMWWNLLGSQNLWWWNPDFNFDEIIDLWHNVWKTWHYYTIELKNDEEKQMYFGWLLSEYTVSFRTTITMPYNYF